MKQVKKSATKTLAQLRALIKKEAPWVDIRPYSHNIINMTLLAIASQFSYDKANKAIDDFNLNLLGWKHHKEPK